MRKIIFLLSSLLLSSFFLSPIHCESKKENKQKDLQNISNPINIKDVQTIDYKNKIKNLQIRLMLAEGMNIVKDKIISNQKKELEKKDTKLLVKEMELKEKNEEINKKNKKERTILIGTGILSIITGVPLRIARYIYFTQKKFLKLFIDNGEA